MISKINGVIKIIKFLVNGILRVIIGVLLSCVIPRDKNILLFSCNPGQTGDLFLHNTKYLFLYLNSIQSDFKAIWLCNNECINSTLKKYGYINVYKRYSLKGIYYALRAKYWLSDYCMADTTYSLLSYNAVGINFWHGASGLKKCGLDDPNGNKLLRKSRLVSYIYDILRIKDSYYIVNSNYEIQCRKSAFNANENQFILLTSPRLDALYNKISNSEILMEEDYANINNLRQLNKKLIIYMPTFRETGEDISDWLSSEKLNKFLNDNQIIIICKLHPFDKNALNSHLGKNFYLMKNNSDVHAILNLTDAMITDYSGVYFDYLHLDKPIIYHVPDLKEFEQQCRGFYRPYETLTAGIYTRTEENLLNAIKDVINGIDNHKEKRKELLNEMYIYHDGSNNERVVNWIRSLNNVKNS